MSARATREAQAYALERRARFGHSPLVWAEGLEEHTDATGTEWTRVADGSSCVVFAPKSYVAKIFKEPNGRIKQEVEIMSVLGDLVPKFGRYVHSPSGTVIGYTMERMDMSLDDYMRRESKKGRPALDETMQKKVFGVILGVCMHATCLDIKPANFAMVNDDVRMIDLGPDYCAVSRDNSTYKARVLFCVLLFCTSVCTKKSDETLLSLTALLRLLLDQHGDPLPIVRAELDKLDADEFGTERLSANIRTGNCVGHFAKGRGLRVARVMNTGMLSPSLLLEYLSQHVKSKRDAS